MKTRNIFKTSLLCIIFWAGNLTAQEKYETPKLDHQNSWSIIMIPDIQNYTKFSQNQPILELMTKWVENNIDHLNIKMVMCVGDLVEQNEIINNGHDGNQTAQKQWEAAAKAFSYLDGKVPYVTATGNHDYTINREGKRWTRLDEFFPIDKNFLNRKTIVQNGVDENEKATLANSAFELKNLNGKDFLFLTLEYAPTNNTIDWANKIVKLEQYKNHQIVMMTHAYLGRDDKRLAKDETWIIFEPYSINNKIQKSERIKLPNSNNGEQIWQKLVKSTSNMQLVLSGHISGEGYKQDKNEAGKSVHQILFDAQSMGGGHNGNGGDGWLRILEFYPDNKTIKVKTFSPLFGISPTTQEHAWKKDQRNEYVITLD
ncbi:metallophosphoesterase [Empedobacter falsenii]